MPFLISVLNTDNMSIVGVTIDYGPFGFLGKSSHIIKIIDDAFLVNKIMKIVFDFFWIIDRYNPDHIFNGSGMLDQFVLDFDIRCLRFVWLIALMLVNFRQRWTLHIQRAGEDMRVELLEACRSIGPDGAPGERKGDNRTSLQGRSSQTLHWKNEKESKFNCSHKQKLQYIKITFFFVGLLKLGLLFSQEESDKWASRVRVWSLILITNKLI